MRKFFRTPKGLLTIVLLCSLAALLPAMVAARLDAAKALRD